MDPIEILYLINQVRFRELIQQAEKEQLIWSIPEKQPAKNNLSLKIFTWIPAQLTKKTKRGKNLREHHRTSDPCCTVTET